MGLRTLVSVGASALIACALWGCGNFTGTNPGDGGYQAYLSECEGFASQEQALSTPPVIPDRGDDLYCDAERLYWEYDLEVEAIEGGYRVTELDDPENMGRCDCMCPFDYLADMDEVEPGSVAIVLEREVSDWEEGSGTILETELDLSEGSGVIVIEDQQDWEGFCQEPTAD